MYINEIRSFIKEQGVDAYMIPSTDEYLNKYPKVKYLEKSVGFTGSNGIAIITADDLYFYTDLRYQLQAKEQLPNFNITFDINDFLQKVANTNMGVIGYNPAVFSCKEIKQIEKYCNVRALNENPLQSFSLQSTYEKQIFTLPPNLYGEDTSTKLQKVVENIAAEADYLLIFNSETCCWLLNIRGEDELYTPTVKCHLLIAKNGKTLFFIEPQKIYADFQLENGEIYEIKKLIDVIKDLTQQGCKISMDQNETPQLFYNIVQKNYIEQKNIASYLKLIKTPGEINNIKNIMLEDAVALTKFALWFKDAPLGTGEVEIADKIDSLRATQENFIRCSFPTIAALNENGAVIHYRSTMKKQKFTQGNDILLLDSGGQYLGGTTDITRMYANGNVSPEFKRNFTIVLKAHISLATTIFKQGTTGAALDAITRKPLWQYEMDYEHATGHGVGYMLGVHEGDIAISSLCNKPLDAGMVLSNEPGFYMPGQYGIRFENLAYIKKVNKDSDYLSLQTLSFVPIDMNLLEHSILNDLEINWIINYQLKSIEMLLPYFSQEQLEYAYNTHLLEVIKNK